jgi:UDP-N-acetylmuramyl pentapeptide phosphotransferase/UDP-N-acetylglucosamine-1-phosphate transferase
MNTESLLPPIWGVFVIAAAVSAGLIAVSQPLMRRYALAHPNARSSHSQPTPQGGGLAVIAATIVAIVAVSIVYGLQDAVLVPLRIVLLAIAAMAVVGAVDDIRTIEVVPRLLCQTVLVAAVLWALPHEFRLIEPLPWWLDRAVMLIAGVWFVNLVNFMDGLDWMTVAEVVPVAAGLVLVGAAGALPPYAVVTAAALGGAIVGFAPFNRPVARLFLGDVGSLPIGLLLGWLLAMLAVRGEFAAAVLLPLYYLADATITVLRRIAEGERPWESHRTHFYQRATAGGFSVREIVTRVFIVNLGLVMLAAATVLTQARWVDAAALAAGALLVGWLLVTFKRGKR